MKIKWILYLAVGAYLVYAVAFSGNNDSSEDPYTYEEEIAPTQGVITTVLEVDSNTFKIEDEVNVPNIDDSRIIAKYMNSEIDTFTLDEAKLATEEDGQNERGYRGGIWRAASYGLMGYFMGRSMGSYRPNASAYVDQKTYNRVTNNAGQNLQNSARRTTVAKPAKGRSGYGKTSRRSTRSYGG